jgi:signal transduction histidine kinase
VLSLAVFAVLYASLVALGQQLRESGEALVVLWPAAGFLFIALWLAPVRLWPYLIVLQLLIEIGIGSVHADPFIVRHYSSFVLANLADGLVGATVARYIIPTAREPKLTNVLLFMASVATGAAVSASLGAYATTREWLTYAYLQEWQIWWAGNWLGSLCIAPILMGWAIRFRAPEFSAPSAPAWEMILIALATLGMTAFIFSTPPNSVNSILHMPFVLLGFVIFAVFRMPPRWSATLVAAIAVLVSYLLSRHLGPFAGNLSPFVRVSATQLYLATLVVVNFLLTVALLERRNAFVASRTSDERYRNFIEHSSEAVWRVELRKPMDPALKVEEQLVWLRDNAYVAESNLTYQRLNRQIGLSDEEARQWRADVPWAAPFIQHLGAAAHKDYEMDGLQFNVQIDRHQVTYITAFRGVMAEGRLVRIWGVARDVTELAALNEQLKQKQERLKQYARELVGAEERARRATAVDLHDGIGQQLVGLSMTLNAMAARSPPEIKLLLSEATNTLREVQDMAQRVIADLSPPGLYELGLEPALKWLSVYMRSKDNLEVQLAIDVVESDLSLELRVLAFKVIRELLRNVVKHAGVLSARVTVTHTDRELHAIVEDAGVGFEWQLSLFEPREHGFGLWSIADRVRDAAGEMQVDTSPGRGCRVSLVFPLTLAVRRYGSQSDSGLRTGNAS